MSRIQRKSEGAILLGDHVSCDGFAFDRAIRVQTHIHHDHMMDFDTSKANQTIVMSQETRDLLEAIYNADLPYRTNLTALSARVPMTVNGDVVELFPSNHMLGSVQVRVTCKDGYRLGYSSDFFWPIDEVIAVDELLVDSTYGDPTRTRTYTQEQADTCYVDRLVRNLSAAKRTAVVAHNGRLQYAINLTASLIRCPILVSPRAFPLVGVYDRHGLPMPPVLRSDSSDAIAILRRQDPCVVFATLTEQRHLPWIQRFAKVHLSAHISRLDDPVTLYDNGDCCIALTDHADFTGTIAYVKATGAKRVWTDPRSGNAEALANAITQQIGVPAAMVPEIHSHGWG